jgi:di/tricarboxylate transporter
MNRVWKKFLGKFVEPLAYMLYSVFAIVFVWWVTEKVSVGMGIIVFLIIIPLPMFVFLVRDMWRDAKREVEWENRDILDTLKGK